MFCYLDKTVIFGKDIRDKHVSKRNLHRTKQCRACNLLLNQLISVEYKEKISAMTGIRHLCSLCPGSQ